MSDRALHDASEEYDTRGTAIQARTVRPGTPASIHYDYDIDGYMAGCH